MYAYIFHLSTVQSVVSIVLVHQSELSTQYAVA